ncbi:hypothetical protein MKW92_030916 [Papaver armeniacum]|nr:hypothetical protein MKW92_030916 [Papaver armeniacum]
MLTTSPDASGETKPGCSDKCGNVSIPYPFGLTSEEGCSIREAGYGYGVKCDSSYDPPKPFIGTTSLQILSISETEIRVSNRIAKICFNTNGDVVLNDSTVYASVRRTPFTFSNTKNRFSLIGCMSRASYLGFDQEDRSYLIQCTSACTSRKQVAEGSCGGYGCCQFSIPKEIKNFMIAAEMSTNVSNSFRYSPCIYSFLGEYEQLTFAESDLLAVPQDGDIPLVLDWAIGNKTCEEAQKDPATYACHGKSYCSNSDNNPGYRCTCFEGYKGNPYFSPGCIDINECEDEKNNPCEGICTNTDGSFNCSCPAGSQGDGRKDERGCNRKVPIIQLTLGKVFPIKYRILTIPVSIVLLLAKLSFAFSQ